MAFPMDFTYNKRIILTLYKRNERLYYYWLTNYSSLKIRFDLWPEYKKADGKRLWFWKFNWNIKRFKKSCETKSCFNDILYDNWKSHSYYLREKINKNNTKTYWIRFKFVWFTRFVEILFILCPEFLSK